VKSRTHAQAGEPGIGLIKMSLAGGCAASVNCYRLAESFSAHQIHVIQEELEAIALSVLSRHHELECLGAGFCEGPLD